LSVKFFRKDYAKTPGPTPTPAPVEIQRGLNMEPVRMKEIRIGKSDETDFGFRDFQPVKRNGGDMMASMMSEGGNTMASMMSDDTFAPYYTTAKKHLAAKGKDEGDELKDSI
jgi:hypothetical protein